MAFAMRKTGSSRRSRTPFGAVATPLRDLFPLLDNPAGYSGRMNLYRQLGIGAISLIAANTAVLWLYFAYDITLFQLVLVYWCECVWIGVFSAVKLIVASAIGDPYQNRWADISPGSAFLMSIFVIFMASSTFFSLIGLVLMAILFANDALTLGTPGDAAINHIGLVFGVSLFLMAAHAISLVANFLVYGEYKTVRVGTLVALPFKRCLALLFMIAASIVFVALVPTFANTTSFAVAVIVLKVLWDILLHIGERRSFASATGS